MSILRHELEIYLANLLQINLFKDYAPNGLQIEGKKNIESIVTAVTASQSVIEQAVAISADALLVHHGYFWSNEPVIITGYKKERISHLLRHNINLFAYHLPLDAHTEFGNNAQLGRLLDIHVSGKLDGIDTGIVFYGELPKPMSPMLFENMLLEKLSRTPLWIPGESNLIHTVAWCSGAAQDYLTYAIHAKLDAFITGEVSERTYYQAKENNIHFFAAGHHATERYGIQALGEHLASQFLLTHTVFSNPKMSLK